MSINDDLPAFPGTEENGLNSGCYGISIRDYFAAKALQGLCAHHDTWGISSTEGVAEHAYLLADKMLKAREP